MTIRRQLAQLVFDAHAQKGHALPAEALTQIDIALGYGGGIVHGNSGIYALLHNPLVPPSHPVSKQHNHFQPIYVAGRIPRRKNKRQILTTKEVADIFRSPTKRRYAVPKGITSTWAPAAVQSLARVTIGGDHGPHCAVSDDRQFPGNVYYWYDLDWVPVTGFVCRVRASGDGNLYQRIAEDQWATAVFDGTMNAIDIACALRTLRARLGREIDRLEPSSLAAPLLRRPVER